MIMSRVSLLLHILSVDVKKDIKMLQKRVFILAPSEVDNERGLFTRKLPLMFSSGGNYNTNQHERVSMYISYFHNYVPL